MDLIEELKRLGLRVDSAETDVVVVGGGGAATRAALSAAQQGARVLMMVKAPLGQGGSTVHGASEIMSMGASGYGNRDDSPDVHYRDTMAAANGFIDPALVRVLAEDAPARIKDLIDYGVPFDAASAAVKATIPEQSFKLIQSDFGSYPRALGVSGKTGKAFVAALADQALALGVDVRSPVGLVDLLFDARGRACGVLGYDAKDDRWLVVSAKTVVLGTGGAHGLFRSQVSTAEMTGDGQAVCYRAGAELVNMEFHQFGPALLHPYVQLFSKSCFVLHPTLKNVRGEEFLPKYLPAGVTEEEVMDEKVFPFTTTNVSRYLDIAIAREIAEGRGTEHGTILMSFDGIPEDKLKATIPHTLSWMRAKGVDPLKDDLDVGIAFQCLNGGVRMIDADARSTLPGVHVIGELAGGVRGPDRPGGNSLAEGQVFGHRAGSAAARDALAGAAAEEPAADSLLQRLQTALKANRDFDAAALADRLRESMQRNALVEKSEAGLAEALAVAGNIEERFAAGGGATPATLNEALTVQNMATTAQIILKACLQRTESRSGHYRTDYPERDDAHFNHAVALKLEGNRAVFSPLPYPRAD